MCQGAGGFLGIPPGKITRILGGGVSIPLSNFQHCTKRTHDNMCCSRNVTRKRLQIYVKRPVRTAGCCAIWGYNNSVRCDLNSPVKLTTNNKTQVHNKTSKRQNATFTYFRCSDVQVTTVLTSKVRATKQAAVISIPLSKVQQQ